MVDELVTHPHVVLTRMNSADAAGVEELTLSNRTDVATPVTKPAPPPANDSGSCPTTR